MRPTTLEAFADLRDSLIRLWGVMVSRRTEVERLKADLAFAQQEAEKWKRKWESGQQAIEALNKMIDQQVEMSKKLRADLAAKRSIDAN